MNGVTAPPSAHLTGWFCRWGGSWRCSRKKHVGLPLQNAMLPQEQPTRVAHAAEPRLERPSAGLPLGNAWLLQGNRYVW
jgi:hypothetical protein